MGVFSHFFVLYVFGYSMIQVYAGLVGQPLMPYENRDRSCDETLMKLMSKLDRQDAKLQELQSTVSLNSEALVESGQRIAELQMMVSGHEQALVEKDQRIIQLQTTVSRHQVAQARRDKRIAQIATTVSEEHEGGLSEMGQRLTQLEKKTPEHEKNISESGQRISQLEIMVSGHDEALSERGQRLAQLEPGGSALNLAIRTRELVNIPRVENNSITHNATVMNGNANVRREDTRIEYGTHLIENSVHNMHAVMGKTTTKHKPSVRVSPAVTPGVAFCASLSAARTSLHVNEVIVFDDVMTNMGGGYNQRDGLFIVPESGMYVFTWTAVSDLHNNIGTTIQINGAVEGILGSYGSSVGNFQSSTGVIVKSVTTGDHVYIKNKYAGIIASDNDAKSTFSGWRLF